MEGRVELEPRVTGGGRFPWVVGGISAMLLIWSVFGVLFFGEAILGLSKAEEGSAPGDFRITAAAWGMLLLPWALVPGLFSTRTRRIVLDSRGIRSFARCPAPFSWFARGWSIRWPELRRVSWDVSIGHLLTARLVLHTASGKQRVQPWTWIASNSKPRWFASAARDPETARRLLNGSPIVEAIKKHRPDLAVEIPPRDGKAGKGLVTSDLTPATGAIAGGFIALVLYFILDTYALATEYYAEGAPVAALAAIGALGTAAAYAGLRATEPRRRDVLAYSLLFGFGVGLAMHPLLVRMNTWTDTAGLQRYEYRLDSDLVWRSPGMPDLTLYSSTSDWWRRFRPGERYVFELRRGGLGFWQVNMAPVYEAQREFYEGRRSRR